jgi:SAM-dependent methyltransferase
MEKMRAGDEAGAATRERRRHWDGVYAAKQPDEVSWFQRSPTVSLTLIGATGIASDAPIVDVGGGASTLVDHLLADGYTHLTVVDIAAAALDASRHRLGARAAGIDWVVADVIAWRPAARFALWHDRAVFHFLTDERDRRGYLAGLEAGLRPGGIAIISTFAIDGPERCSGLPVQRYSPDTLAAELGPGFALEQSVTEDHVTPVGRTQRFVCCRFRRL